MKRVLRRDWKLIDGAYYVLVNNRGLGTDPPVEHVIERTGDGWRLSKRVTQGKCLGGVSWHRTLEEAQWAAE